MNKFLIEDSNDDVITLIKEPIIFSILGLVLLNVLNYAVYFCYLLIPIFIILQRKNYHLYDYNIVNIFLFSLFYSLIVIIYDSFLSRAIIIGYFFFPPIFYYLGKYLVSKYPSVLTVYFLLFFVCIMFSILPFAANLRSVAEIGFMQDRNLRMFWMKGDGLRSATLMGTYFASNMALLPLLFAQKSSKIEKRLTLLSLILFVIALFSTLNMSNRTGLFISAGALLLFIFIPKNNGLKSSFLIFMFLIIIAIIYSMNVWNIKSWFEFSSLSERLSSTGLNEENSRVFIWKSNFLKLIHNPFGFSNPANKISFAHNLWLDVGRVAGIVPMIPLLIFTLSAGVSIAKVIFTEKLSIFLRVLVAGFGIGFLITFSLEPIMEGAFIMFLSSCFFFGIIVGIRKYII